MGNYIEFKNCLECYKCGNLFSVEEAEELGYHDHCEQTCKECLIYEGELDVFR